MAASHLTAVTNTTAANPENLADVVGLARPAETGAQRIRRLQHEARMLAREQVEGLARDFEALARSAEEIAEGGEAYPPGVRELASRLAADLPQKAQLLVTLMNRTGQA
jgi:hypothetical protein